MIAIKDMKMPTECGYCGFYRYYPENGNVWCNAKNRILKMYWKDLDWTHLDVERPDWCPLIEIKTDGDTISRHMAIDAALKLTYADGAYGYADAKELVDSLETLPSAQPERLFEIQDILDYLDTVLHPIISPEHWNVYSELHDMISTLPSAQPDIKQAAKLLSDFIESCPGGDSYLITPDGEELRTDWGYATEGIQLIHDWAEMKSDG